MMRRTIPLVVALLASLARCATSGTPACYVGADCATGACSAQGECVATVTVGTGIGDGGTTTGEGGGSSSPDAADEASSATPLPGADSGTCVPNNDGTITRDEVPMAVGLRATYLVADSVTWDTTGTIGDAGARTWDLTGSLTGDHSVIFEAESPTGAWWASSFAAATFSMPLVASSSDVGIFQVGDESLSLIGVASATSGAEDTEVKYATPIPTLQFPLSLNATWTTTSNVTGTYNGIPDTTYTENYVTAVDAAGQMKTPFGDFSVLRVGTVLTQTVGLVKTVTESFVWVAECVGPVAAATSQSNTTTAEFSSDAEVRRLSP
jgi:hypothetical protein